MRSVKVGKDRLRLELLYGDEYIRRVVTLRELAEFMRGGLPEESNLGSGREPLSFSEFSRQHYLPLDAERRLKKSSFTRENESIQALSRYFGGMALHKISRQDWDGYQRGRLSGELSARKKPCSPSGLLKEFKCLRNVLSYAESAGYIRRNALIELKPRKLGLFDRRRADIWLSRKEILRVIRFLPRHLRNFFRFMVLTGARPDEACQFGKANIEGDYKGIWIVTIKKRKTDANGDRKRRFRTASLGPWFQALLRSLVPHPETGLFFCNPETGRRYVARYLQLAFKTAAEQAKLGRRVVPYDLRGTFAMHRAMVVQSFRQLQSEMGHLDPKSIQNYLDEASSCDSKASIFRGVDTSWEGKKSV